MNIYTFTEGITGKVPVHILASNCEQADKEAYGKHNLNPRVWVMKCVTKPLRRYYFENSILCGNCNGEGLQGYMDYCRACNGTGIEPIHEYLRRAEDKILAGVEYHIAERILKEAMEEIDERL